MSTTTETRREAHELIIPKKARRWQMVYDALVDNGPSTAEELADRLFMEGKIPYSSRTFTAPRLTELKRSGLVETCGKRQSRVSGNNIAIWRAT